MIRVADDGDTEDMATSPKMRPQTMGVSDYGPRTMDFAIDDVVDGGTTDAG